ncbi:hypothetical protein EN742_32050 [Mesorhizobium sp. M4A.F.Ca.ET.020.02.1.1]|uniref:hypothetical protein n=1 Tax=unclassified Mesorhizobium TaxID=325217 RepID=UPI000FD28E3B|nr:MULTISPECIES: hypothetical protein [unclassified Mesorhizobium]RVD32536.1 hypothetical protein EN742_32050 [Mesorhizobium sp. M4A.F.Ca.ET.020.02.1.1]RWC20891.1 MAG: hypothetical protein EOS53_08035 [Mesorhizobium sp.]TIX64739.1 MAG: hypothetical protein E5V33_09495 [Mesorhizobium sp.]
MALAPDATLMTVGPKNPQTYYPPLVKRLLECASVHGAAYMRIGTNGNGTAPYNLITADEDGALVFGAFDYGHPFEYDIKSSQWSTKPMGMHEVLAVALQYLE